MAQKEFEQEINQNNPLFPQPVHKTPEDFNWFDKVGLTERGRMFMEEVAKLDSIWQFQSYMEQSMVSYAKKEIENCFHVYFSTDKSIAYYSEARHSILEWKEYEGTEDILFKTKKVIDDHIETLHKEALEKSGKTCECDKHREPMPFIPRGSSRRSSRGKSSGRMSTSQKMIIMRPK